MTPSRFGYRFTPPSQSFPVLHGNQTANFTALALYRITVHLATRDVTVTLSGSQTATCDTGIDLGCQFPGLDEGGSYSVTPSKPNYRFIPPSISFANLRSDQFADFIGRLFYTIGGRTTDVQGAGLNGATIALSGSQTTTTQTAGGGNYSLNVEPGGTYIVIPTLAGSTFVPPFLRLPNLGSNQVVNFIAVASRLGTLPPVADAYVRDGAAANTNFGTSEALQVQTDSAPDTGLNRDTYLKFDTNGVATIASARLRLYGAWSGPGSGTLSAYPVSATNWVEATITWNNRPARGATALSNVTVDGAVGTWYELDVINYVLSERAAGRNVISLALHNTSVSSAWISLNSREAPANGPQLGITTSNLVNSAPLVNAGSDQSINLSASANLHGAVADDGLPSPPGIVTVGWSTVSGPGTVTFGNANAMETQASFSLPGAYVLRLTASDGSFAVSNDTAIAVNDDGGPPPSIDPDTGGVVNLKVYPPLRGLISPQ